MAASREDIEQWLREGPKYNATHMLVKCAYFGDASESCCYPVYVLAGEDPRKKATEVAGMTMEAYSYSMDIATQLREVRANHWD